MIPPEERPTAAELQARSSGTEPLQIAGRPATACPYCGCGMFVNGTHSLATRVDRYERCRNCRRTFVTRQTAKVFVREVGNDDEFSSAGKDALSIYRDAG